MRLNYAAEIPSLAACPIKWRRLILPAKNPADNSSNLSFEWSWDINGVIFPKELFQWTYGISRRCPPAATQMGSKPLERNGRIEWGDSPEDSKTFSRSSSGVR